MSTAQSHAHTHVTDVIYGVFLGVKKL